MAFDDPTQIKATGDVSDRGHDDIIYPAAIPFVMVHHSTMGASRCAISSLRLRSVISTNMFTAPTTWPVASRSGDGNAKNGMRVVIVSGIQQVAYNTWLDCNAI